MQKGSEHMIFRCAEVHFRRSLAAAHERVLYEQIVHADNGAAQRLLDPVSVELPPAESEWVVLLRWAERQLILSAQRMRRRSLSTKGARSAAS